MAALPTVGGSVNTWGTELNAWLVVARNADGTLKVSAFGRRFVAFAPVINLATGYGITSEPIFASFYASTLTKIGILTTGTPAGIDNSNTVILTIKNNSGTTIVSKTYNAATQPPTKAFEDLGALVETAFASNEYLTVTVTQGTTANMPAFILVIE